MATKNTNRYPRVSQLTRDVKVDNNRATVQGILGRPLPEQLPDSEVGGTMILAEDNGKRWTLVRQIPASFLPPVDAFDGVILTPEGGIVYVEDPDSSLVQIVRMF